MEWIYETWPWYIAGPLLAGIMFALLFAGKQFGMSSNLRTLCSIGGAGKAADFFRFDWRKQRWNLMVVLGALLGGFFASTFLSNHVVEIDQDLAQKLSREYQIHSAGEAYLPTELFGSDNLTDPLALFVLVVGGFLVGFGAPYAGGCTSGQAISGLSNLQLPSLLAVIGFFLGGLIMVHLLFPILF